MSIGLSILLQGKKNFENSQKNIDENK